VAPNNQSRHEHKFPMAGQTSHNDRSGRKDN
jgi:hypothetical protein